MILAHVEVGKNIRNVAEKTDFLKLGLSLFVKVGALILIF
mgnify:CR=1 FL=1